MDAMKAILTRRSTRRMKPDVPPKALIEAVVEAGRAAIYATVEPVAAALLGILAFHEPLTLTAALGVALILAAVVLLNRRAA